MNAIRDSFNKDLISRLYNERMVDTVGSLTQFQRSVIIGSLLGDGHLRIFPGRSNALLEINHSFRQKEYVDWKYSTLMNVSASPPKARNGSQGRVAYRFHSKQLSALTEFHGLFYGSGRKAIPDGLRLNPVILAVWYMDDGSKCGENNYYLNTQQYALSDQEKLRERLRNIGLESRLNKDKIYWRLRFLGASAERLKKIILPHIIPSMSYKLGYNPVETSLPVSGQR